MAIVEQLHDAVTGEFGESASVPYLVTDAAAESDVKTACEASIPSAYSGLVRKSMEVTERINATSWRVVARYKKSSWTWPSGTTPDARFSFATGGGTQHINQSLATVGRYGPSSTLDHKGAINFDGKTVNGTDILVSNFRWNETHWFTDAEITDGYKAALAALTGQVNDDTFRGFAAEEVLFLGADGDRQGDDPSDLWSVSFAFAAQKSGTRTVGDITGVVVTGWQYPWVVYQQQSSTAGIVAVPIAVYVERVYNLADFDGLGI